MNGVKKAVVTSALCFNMGKGIMKFDAEERALKAGYETVRSHGRAITGKLAGEGVIIAAGMNKLPDGMDPIEMREEFRSKGEFFARQYEYKNPKKWIDTSKHSVRPPETSESHEARVDLPENNYGISEEHAVPAEAKGESYGVEVAEKKNATEEKSQNVGREK